jgi:hypothetical protein
LIDEEVNKRIINYNYNENKCETILNELENLEKKINQSIYDNKVSINELN